MGHVWLIAIAFLHSFAAIAAAREDRWLLAGLLLTFAVGDVILAFMAKGQ